MLNVNQMLAKANHEKINEKMLYCKERLTKRGRLFHRHEDTTYQRLDVEKEHSNDPVT